MNVYVATGGKVLEFQSAEMFEFTPISQSKALVEVKALAEGDYGKKPEERRYQTAGRVVIGEGDFVELGMYVPTPMKVPTLNRKGLFVGSKESWHVLQPITNHENVGEILKVFGNMQREGRSEEQMIALFWLRVGDLFGTESDINNLPRQLEAPGPVDPAR